MSVNSVQVNSNTEVTFTIENTGSGEQSTDVEFDVDHDLSSVSPATSVGVTVTANNGDVSGTNTDTFDIVGVNDITVDSDADLTDGSNVEVSVSHLGFSGSNVGSLVVAYEDVDGTLVQEEIDPTSTGSQNGVSVTNAASGADALTFEIDPTVGTSLTGSNLQTGDYEFAVALESADDDIGTLDLQNNNQVTDQFSAAGVSITDATPLTIDGGTTTDISVTVENTGSSSQDVSVAKSDGSNVALSPATRDALGLGTGETATVTFSADAPTGFSSNTISFTADANSLLNDDRDFVVNEQSTSTSSDVTFYDDDFAYQGQDVLVDLSNTDQSVGSTVRLRGVDSFDNNNIDSSSNVEQLNVERADTYTSQFPGTGLADSDSVVLVETDDLESGDYFIRGSGIDEIRANTFEVGTQSLSVEFDDDSVNDAGSQARTDLDISSNRATYSMNVSADGDL
ncbi:hypothetical protein FK85_27995, partial [Halorubrum saccharovorum]